MPNFVIIVALIIVSISGFSTDLHSQKKSEKAVRTYAEIKIDGKLNESDWKNAAVFNDFNGFYPIFGKKPAQKTEVRVLYDDRAIYFAAILYDEKPDSIYTELTMRDKDNGNVDYFGLSLNPNNDGQNIYEFVVSAANVQTDIRISEIDDDYAWDAVWYSAVSVVDEGWIVEIEIPYSAIRFPKLDKQTWSINFWRTVRRNREKSSWNPVDLNKGSEGSQMGIVKEINNIQAPLRLALMPYVSGYINSYEQTLEKSFSGGLDLKLGLSETYTLDMTLIPDFVQTKADEVVLNLTPYETYYSENRPFFTEGTELFNKCDLFYSRRIGKTPQGFSTINNQANNNEFEIIKNPSVSRLINSFKISGRSKNNLAIGVFNAITANTWAKVKYNDDTEKNILTEPATNYNILVLDQSIGQNSFINFTNASAISPNNKYLSNVAATYLKIMDKSNLFGVAARGAYSTRNANKTNIDNGWYLDASAGKKTGKWIYELGTEIISNEYNPNDLGYLTEFNQIKNYVEVAYRKFSQFWVFNEMVNSVNITHKSLFENMSFVGTNIHLYNYATTTKHLSFWNNITIPLSDENDYYEPRTIGRFYSRPGIYSENIFISTDYRKQLAFDIKVGVYFDQVSRKGVWGSLSPLIRIGKRVSLRYTLHGDFDLGAAGFVENNEGQIIFGTRDVITFINSLNSTLVFTNKLSLSLTARHYVSGVEYLNYYDLLEDGNLKNNNNYTGTSNYNFNVLNIDLLLSWNFLPGSYLSVMWKNQIFALGDVPNTNRMPNYYESFKQVWHEPQANNLSLKLIYYLDYNSIIGN